MSSLQESLARTKIQGVFTSLGILKPGLQSLTKLKGGKLYELFVLSKLLLELACRGYTFQFSSSTVAFKTGGGPINGGDFHIDVVDGQGCVVGQIYTDVEVRTLGWKLGLVVDLSQYHETDILVVEPGTSGYPEHTQVLLGIECKATAKFLKSHVREALGRRRELSFYSQFGRPAFLSPGQWIFSDPPSEYWLCFIDPAGQRYIESPAVFSVELKHLQP